MIKKSLFSIVFILTLVSVNRSEATYIVQKQPLISQQILEQMSKSAIRKKYPFGITVSQKNLSPPLKEKLSVLEKSGYCIKWNQASKERLQEYAQYVTRRHGLNSYLSKILDQNAGCSSYLHDRLLDRGLNKSLSDDEQLVTLDEIKNKLPTFYHHILQTHRYWSFIGSETMNHADAEIVLWLDRGGKDSESIVKKALAACNVHLTQGQLAEISRIMALQYLCYAVEGLYYQSLLSPVTYYRKMAIESLDQD